MSSRCRGPDPFFGPIFAMTSNCIGGGLLGGATAVDFPWSLAQPLFQLEPEAL